MAEEPRRLSPTREVLRELYLKSGNQCAFPGCMQVMIDSNGVFVGQLCHIEAAMPDGQRFNPGQTNEQRRAFANLLLMCYPHHRVTDDVVQYPVERLRQLKSEHEAVFTDIPGLIRQSIADQTTLIVATPPTRLKKLHDVLGWDLSEEELRASLQELIQFVEDVAVVPLPTRELLAIIVARATTAGCFPSYQVLPLPELMYVTSLPLAELRDHLAILAKYGIAAPIDYEDDSGEPLEVHLYSLESGWDFPGDLAQFAKKTGIALYEILVRLRFDLLD